MRLDQHGWPLALRLVLQTYISQQRASLNFHSQDAEDVAETEDPTMKTTEGVGQGSLNKGFCQRESQASTSHVCRQSPQVIPECSGLLASPRTRASQS